MKFLIVLSVLALSALNGDAFLFGHGKSSGSVSSSDASSSAISSGPSFESSSGSEASAGASGHGGGGFDIGSLLA